MQLLFFTDEKRAFYIFALCLVRCDPSVTPLYLSHCAERDLMKLFKGWTHFCLWVHCATANITPVCSHATTSVKPALEWDSLKSLYFSVMGTVSQNVMVCALAEAGQNTWMQRLYTIKQKASSLAFKFAWWLLVILRLENKRFPHWPPTWDICKTVEWIH